MVSFSIFFSTSHIVSFYHFIFFHTIFQILHSYIYLFLLHIKYIQITHASLFLLVNTGIYHHHTSMSSCHSPLTGKHPPLTSVSLLPPHSHLQNFHFLDILSFVHTLSSFRDIIMQQPFSNGTNSSSGIKENIWDTMTSYLLLLVALQKSNHNLNPNYNTNPGFLVNLLVYERDILLFLCVYFEGSSSKFISLICSRTSDRWEKTWITSRNNIEQLGTFVCKFILPGCGVLDQIWSLASLQVVWST